MLEEVDRYRMADILFLSEEQLPLDEHLWTTTIIIFSAQIATQSQAVGGENEHVNSSTRRA